MTVIPIAQCPVRRRVNLFGCCYLCLMSTNCLCEHARARACARPAPAPALRPHPRRYSVQMLMARDELMYQREQSQPGGRGGSQQLEAGVGKGKANAR
jgi:hypothetical protein